MKEGREEGRRKRRREYGRKRGRNEAEKKGGREEERRKGSAELLSVFSDIVDLYCSVSFLSLPAGNYLRTKASLQATL